MTGIAINGEFLDLPPGVVLEIIRNSPYINNDAIDGEYSLPVALPYTDKNYRLIAYSGNHYKTHAKQTLDAELYADGAVYNGSLIVDGWDKNNNQPQSLVWSTMFVFGISSFFQEVKEKKITDLSLGGVRSFAWTTADPFDASAGFWQHVHTVATTPIEYTFVPIKNADYKTGMLEWMNRITPSGGSLTSQMGEIYNLACCCPGIKLSYVLQKCFTENGWEVEGDILSDATFDKIFIQSFRGIYWCDFDLDVSPYAYTALSTVEFYLKDHLPANYTIRNFIIDVKNKYNIGFRFNKQTKKCTLVTLNNVGTSAAVDLTAFSNSAVKTKFTEASRVIALKNTINDAYPQILLDTSAVISVQLKGDLPAASSVSPDAIYFVLQENVFYQAIGDNGGTKYWLRLADNVGNYNEKDSTESLDTNIQSFAQSWQSYRVNGTGRTYYGNFCTCSQIGNYKQKEEEDNWGLITFQHHGTQLDMRDDGSTTGTTVYWYATNTSIDNYGNDLGGWSNVYENKHGLIDNGIYATLFKDWILLFKSTDSRIFILSLPLYLLQTIEWENLVAIHNVRFLVKNIKYTVPYNGKTELELLKID